MQRSPEFLERPFFSGPAPSPIRYEPDVLELSKISARVAEGEVNGYFAMQPETRIPRSLRA
jgi:hypothetical protein